MLGLSSVLRRIEGSSTSTMMPGACVMCSVQRICGQSGVLAVPLRLRCRGHANPAYCSRWAGDPSLSTGAPGSCSVNTAARSVRQRICLSRQPVAWSARTNQAPEAQAGADLSVNGGASVQLDGRGSTDPDGAIARYAWVQTEGPLVTLSGAATATPSFSAPVLDDDLRAQLHPHCHR